MTAQVRLPRGKKQWPRTVTVGNASVKIYEVNHLTNATGKAYVLVWKSSSGARERQKFADPGAAVAEAKIKAGQLAIGHVEAADMTSADRHELQAARQIAGGIPLLPPQAQALHRRVTTVTLP